MRPAPAYRNIFLVGNFSRFSSLFHFVLFPIFFLFPNVSFHTRTHKHIRAIIPFHSKLAFHSFFLFIRVHTSCSIKHKETHYIYIAYVGKFGKLYSNVTLLGSAHYLASPVPYTRSILHRITIAKRVNLEMLVFVRFGIFLFIPREPRIRENTVYTYVHTPYIAPAIVYTTYQHIHVRSYCRKGYRTILFL